MIWLLTMSKLLIGFGILLSILAVFFPGPGTLTLFLSFGQVGLIIGIVLYLTVVLKDLKEKDVL
jgi:hypothetical protein